MTTFDSRRFRKALGQFPTGVIVLTARTRDGLRLGMTMSSFNSVSLDPPLVLFSIHRQAASLPEWRHCNRYAINVLNEEQEELSNRFARSGANKWAGLSPLATPAGVPLIPNALVAFECEPYARHDGGDHEIFVGRVLDLHEGAAMRGQPILFFDGRYRRLEPAAAAHAAPIGAYDPHGW
jgi:flavin reductase (DIM6/NTAB) family NADH-FMN oxidoreductase RutF